MLKVFLKHLIYEKCIDIIFDGIMRSFTKLLLKYEIINVELVNENDFIKRRYTFKYGGKLNTVEIGVNGDLREVFKSEMDRELNNIVEDVIESHIRDMESGYYKKAEEMLIESHERLIADESGKKYILGNIDGNIEPIDFDDLPPEIKKHLGY